MHAKVLSWAAVLLLLIGLPLVLVISGNEIQHPPDHAPALTPEPATGAQRMERRLHECIDKIDLTRVSWGTNDLRVTMLRKELAQVTDFKSQVVTEFSLGDELLSDGQNEEALQHFDQAEINARQHGLTFSPADRQHIRMQRVQAHMRIGEIENCCASHNADSCLVPLRGGAIYQRQEGPRMAIRLLEDQLAEVPGDWVAIWLLNVSHMTLGTYPDAVPKKWLIDPKVFASDYDIKRFPEVATGAGLDTYGLSGGCIVDDFDGDGLMDVIRSDMGLTAQLRFFHNNGDGTFTDRTKEAGLIGEIGGLNITSADFDNDGHLDILVLRGGWLGKGGAVFPKSLLRNNGDGTFTDVTERAGLLAPQASQTAVWLDYDGDGWLDVFVGNETTDPNNPHPCELFHNNHDGTFTECAAASGIRVAEFVKAVASADYNKDGRPDLYVSQMGGGSNLLFRNDGPRDPADPKVGWKFTNVTETAGLSEPIRSFPCWFFDYDNDGWPDIFVGGYGGGAPAVIAEYCGQPSDGEHARLYHNNHDGTFTNVAADVGLDKCMGAMAGNFGDLDNDGFLDFYLGTGEPAYTAIIPNRMFRNDGGKRFQDVTTSGGFGHLQKGHGIAFADLNNDGQQDIYEVMGGAFTGDKYYSVLYANPGHEGHWVTLSLEGVQSNRGAVGATLRFVVATAQGDRNIYRTVSTGGSFGCSPLRQQIGLGNAEAIKFVEVFWPVTGRTQRLPGMPMDRFYKIREGDPEAVPWKLPTFHLLGTTAPHLSIR